MALFVESIYDLSRFSRDKSFARSKTLDDELALWGKCPGDRGPKPKLMLDE